MSRRRGLTLEAFLSAIGWRHAPPDPKTARLGREVWTDRGVHLGCYSAHALWGLLRRMDLATRAGCLTRRAEKIAHGARLRRAGTEEPRAR